MNSHLVPIRRLVRKDPFTAVEALVLGLVLAGVGAAVTQHELDLTAPYGLATPDIVVLSLGGGITFMALVLLGHGVYDLLGIQRSDGRAVPGTWAGHLRARWRMLETVVVVLWWLSAPVTVLLALAPGTERVGPSAFKLFWGYGGFLFVSLVAVRIAATVIYRTLIRAPDRSRSEGATGGDSSAQGTASGDETAGRTGASRGEPPFRGVLGDSYLIAKVRLLAGFIGATVLGLLVGTFLNLSGIARLASTAGTLCALGLLLVVAGHARSDLTGSGTADGRQRGMLAVVGRLGQGLVELLGALLFVFASLYLAAFGAPGLDAGLLSIVTIFGPLLLLLGFSWFVGSVLYLGLGGQIAGT